MAPNLSRFFARSITEAEANLAGTLGYVCTIPGTALCFLVLVAYGVASFYAKARQHLDRVSFRLLVYTLIFHVLYGIAFSVTAAQTGPGSLCNFGAFAVNFTLSFATFFTTCIAINLQLVLVHRVNGRKMEKYYIIGTTLLALAITVPTYGLDQFGWNEDSFTCWFKNPNPHTRLQWLIGTQSFWIALAATIETVCSSVVLIWMYRFQITTKYLQKASHPSYSLSTRGGMTTRNTGRTWDTSSSSTRVLGQAHKYRSVILRIALYPIVSLMINFSTVALDLNSTIVGTTDEFQYRLLVLDLCLYGFRTAAYAVLAIFDPGFTKAIREIRKPKSWSTGDTGRTVSNPRFASGQTQQSGKLVINVELEMGTYSDSTAFKDSKIHSGSGDDSEAQITQKPDLQTDSLEGQTTLPTQTRIDEESIARTQYEMELEQDKKFERQL
ncbi:hypothetical protein GYMLUDRAFT_41613 [Collybiopsis luxurians FD-317 M1]|uniref:G-protein coupled receptors family 2 profile 2 domain-containing protein n=1 Tax=Collybiopsis luxurians FD-317 M1 TaxID=944289 RepID=A0A0D0C3J5_9AGAR|nr:hypothetical protein GYMLUDRAFT_41613 [Collybiopsis luxurians FD-317 M1]